MCLIDKYYGPIFRLEQKIEEWYSTEVRKKKLGLSKAIMLSCNNSKYIFIILIRHCGNITVDAVVVFSAPNALTRRLGKTLSFLMF